jgi:Sec63 Brl domain
VHNGISLGRLGPFLEHPWAHGLSSRRRDIECVVWLAGQVEDSDNEHIYHSEIWTLTKKMMSEPAQQLAFTIPVFEPLPSQYYIR